MCRETVYGKLTWSICLKARLHRRFLSRQLDAIFVALKLQQVSSMFETPAIWRRQIALKIASSCRDKNRQCKRALISLQQEPGLQGSAL